MDISDICGKVKDYKEDGVRKNFRINLGIHVVYYNIFSVFTDGSIRKLNIIYHGIYHRVSVIFTNDIYIAVLGSTNYFQFLDLTPPEVSLVHHGSSDL